MELAEIPVLLLRDKLDKARAARLEALSYGALVAEAHRDLDRLATPPIVRITDASRSLTVEQTPISLSALEFVIYRLFADRRRTCPKQRCPGCETCGLKAKDFLDGSVVAGLRSIMTDLRIRDERARLLSGWGTEAPKPFRESQSPINRKIRQALGVGEWASRYLIAAGGKRRGTIYCLPMAPDLVRLE